MTQDVQLHDKVFELYLSEGYIQERVKDIAEGINRDFSGKDPVFVSILNGSFLFAADLIRYLNFQCQIEFVKAASYEAMQSTGEVKTLIGFNQAVEGRPIVIIEDIIDTGRTIKQLMNDLTKYNPESVHVATLTLKREALIESFDPDYVGFEVPNVFIVGYGLDYDQLGRNLKGIYKLKDQ